MTRARFDYFRVTLKPEHELPNERDQYGKTPFKQNKKTLRPTKRSFSQFRKIPLSKKHNI